MSMYYVTGGLGVIGSQFSTAMLDQGHSVDILDASEEHRNLWTATQLIKKYGDRVRVFTERLETSKLTTLKEADFILHAAAHTGIPHSSLDPTDDWVSNVDATRHLLETMRKNKYKIPMVALSSVKPYQTSGLLPTVRATRYESAIDVAITEECVLEPDEPYAASKMAQSALCMAYGRTYDLPVTVYRCSNLYGPAPCHGPRHGWLTWFCISAVIGREIKLQGNGKQTRDMLFSSDVTSAVLAGLEHMEKCQGKVFNVGGGWDNTVSCMEAITKIESKGKVLQVAPAPGRVNEDLLFVTDYTKFHNATGWDPKINVDQGISRILEWAQDNAKALEDIYA